MTNKTTAHTRDTPDDETLSIGVIDVEYTCRTPCSQQKQPFIHVFGRDKDDRLWQIDVHGFSPYFYVPADEAPVSEADPRIKEITDAEESIRSEPMVQITTKLPSHVKQLRRDYDHHEADIRFPDRFRIDHHIQNGMEVPTDAIVSKPGSVSASGGRCETGDTAGRQRGQAIVSHHDVAPTRQAATPQVQYIDTEVDDRDGVADAETASESVISLSIYDTDEEKYIAWLNRPSSGVTVDQSLSSYESAIEQTSGASALPGSAALDVEVHVCDSEAHLLSAYCAHVERTDPDIITGWNIADDIESLIGRLNALAADETGSLSADRLSRLDETWLSSRGTPTIKGRVVFDLLDGYKTIQRNRKESYRLDAIAQRELGVTKQSQVGKLGTLWEEDPSQLLEHTVQTVELLVALDTQEELIQFWDDTRRFVGCSLEDITDTGDACDMYILHALSENYVLPSKGAFSEDAGDGFRGGHVFDAITDLLELVGTLDVKSLYPMVMDTLNASPETKVDPTEFDGPTIEAPNGVHFRSDTDGELRKIINELLQERETLKTQRNRHNPGSEAYERLDRQQAATKVVMNAIYGTFGWTQFRLYDPEITAAVTSTGRKLLRYTAEYAEKLGFDVVYGDSDSILVDLPSLSFDDAADVLPATQPSSGADSRTTPQPEQPAACVVFNPPERFAEAHPELVDDDGTLCVSESVSKSATDLTREEKEALVTAVAVLYWLEEQINSQYDGFAQEFLDVDFHRFQIEAETVYWRYLQAGKKKRYAGETRWKEGSFVTELTITGFECKRSDSASITTTAQKQTIKMLVEGKPREEVISYLQSVVGQVKRGEIDDWELAIPGRIGQPLEEYDQLRSPQRGAIYANAVLGTNYGEGSKPRRLYLSGVHQQFWERLKQEAQIDPRENPEQYERFQEFRKRQDVIAVSRPEQIPPEFMVDRQKMLRKTVESPISRVLEAVSIDWEAISGGEAQTPFEQFF